jgi:hypothetical protein
VTAETKQGALWVLTGLAVAYVRHGLETNWAWWESVEQFLIAWFVHSMRLALFIVVAGHRQVFRVFLDIAGPGYRRRRADAQNPS